MNTTNLNEFDTPMLRDLYRQLRTSALRVLGGTTEDFRQMCDNERKRLELDNSSRSWVIAAMEIDREARLIEKYEEDREETLAWEKEHDAWEAAMEQKYDFMKEEGLL